MIKYIFLSLICAWFFGCSAAVAETDTFLAAVSLKDGVYPWAAGKGSSIDPWGGVSSIVVQNQGKTIVVFTAEVPPVRYILTYNASISSNQAYYKNTIDFTPAGAAAPLKVERWAGIRVANSRLVWAGYQSYPTSADYDLVKTQADFDAFNTRFWAKDKIRFTSEYAELGS